MERRAELRIVVVVCASGGALCQQGSRCGCVSDSATHAHAILQPLVAPARRETHDAGAVEVKQQAVQAIGVQDAKEAERRLCVWGDHTQK